LNAARNAIAHAEYGKLQKLGQEGYPLVLKTVRQWQGSLNGLAVCMDRVVGASLAQLLRTQAPW